MAEERDQYETTSMDEHPEVGYQPPVEIGDQPPEAAGAQPPEARGDESAEAHAEAGHQSPDARPEAGDQSLDARPEAGYQPPSPAGWSDPLTGTDGPHLWDRVLASEAARVRRYHRPATVALVEIVGMDEFTRVWGAEIAERTFVRVARTLAVEIRSSDHIARVDLMRFAVLLTETDEIAAINFIERARAACERQPGELRIAIGWASPTAEEDLLGAFALAEKRLLDELGTPTTADADPD